MGDISLGHKINKFFQPTKYAISVETVHSHLKCHRMMLSMTMMTVYHDDDTADDKFDDDGEDYADLLHPVQVLKNHL